MKSSVTIRLFLGPVVCGGGVFWEASPLQVPVTCQYPERGAHLEGSGQTSFPLGFEGIVQATSSQGRHSLHSVSGRVEWP